ncbi:hypothetical protein LCGC14_1208070 [marine sediment metagenome]|uniref:Uncharacterized protein n=1 Tax=marine sediment metagenome TaxID=412755 RepID=A0A0F9M280_9ZZZZ
MSKESSLTPEEILIEEMAELAHLIWQRRMGYMLVNLDKEHIERWKRQANTAYKDLSEQEKASDRNIAEQYLTKLRLAKNQDVCPEWNESEVRNLLKRMTVKIPVTEPWLTNVASVITDYHKLTCQGKGKKLDKTLDRFREALQESREEREIDLSEEEYEVFCSIQNDAIAKKHRLDREKEIKEIRGEG